MITLEVYCGLLTTIRVLKINPLIVEFWLIDEKLDLKCLAISQKVANIVSFLPEYSLNAVVYGHFNNKKQFIVSAISTKYG